MERYSDDELVYMMRCGSQEALNYLYQRYYKYVAKWIIPFTTYHILGYEYEDYLQMAMMHFPLILDCYRDDQKASLKTFMKYAMTRRLLTVMQQGKDVRILRQQNSVSLDDWVGDDERLRFEEIIEDPSQRYRPEMTLVIKETGCYYMGKIAEQASSREIEIMDYIRRGYNQTEIAKQLHISIKSVYNAIYRYHKKLQAIDERK